jgi:hypothetical protein
MASRKERVTLESAIDFLDSLELPGTETAHHGHLATIALQEGFTQEVADLAASVAVGYWPMWLDECSPIARTAMEWFEQRWCGCNTFTPAELTAFAALWPSPIAPNAMGIAAVDRLARRVGIDDLHHNFNGHVVAYDA